MSTVPVFVVAVIFTVLQLFVFLLALIGTPLPQVRAAGQCTTLFGVQSACYSTAYEAHNSQYGCAAEKQAMTIASAFAVISVVLAFVTLIFAILMHVGVRCLVVIPFVLMCCGVITLCIPWAILLWTRSVDMCNVLGVRYTPNEGATLMTGFILIVVAWSLQVVNLLVFTVLGNMW
ncbi:amastin-like surface protein-like protein [Angomonas deanei]|nr:amastin-like surface protein-like protein [Angomonas deanei]|eukprot:EPY20492.1 amastin-like surface protein-like protein [Angomonas deanei]